jgi:hypothetical protein
MDFLLLGQIRFSALLIGPMYPLCSVQTPNQTRKLVFPFEVFLDIRKKTVGWEFIRKSSIWILPGITGSFWAQSFQTFFVLSYLGLKDRLKKIFCELRDH